MKETWGSTCHGAGRAKSRNQARNLLDYQDVIASLEHKGVSVSPSLSSLSLVCLFSVFLLGAVWKRQRHPYQ